MYLSFDYFKRTLIAKTGLDPSGLAKYAAGERRARIPSTKVSCSQAPPPSPPPTNASSSSMNETNETSNYAAANVTQNAVIPLAINALGAHVLTTARPDDDLLRQPASIYTVDVPYSFAQSTHYEIPAIRSGYCNTSHKNGALNKAYTNELELVSISSTVRPTLRPSVSECSVVCSSSGSTSNNSCGSPKISGSAVDDRAREPTDLEDGADTGVKGYQLVLDCSSWSGIDYTALEQLIEVRCNILTFSCIKHS